MIARHLIIHGRVHGVFYRDWTVATARELGVAGGVRNRADGPVEAHLEGEADAVRELGAAMYEGPPAARVERIEVAECSEEGLVGFTRR